MCAQCGARAQGAALNAKRVATPGIQGHNDPPQRVQPSTGLSSRGGERQGLPKPPNFLSQPYPAVPGHKTKGAKQQRAGDQRKWGRLATCRF